tara:strand:- start:26 stop:292 length:267 start_codon:yes stop_codon:yes gene_type:complete
VKQFIYKSIITVLAVILIYEFTIGKQVKQLSKQTNYILTKEGRKEGVTKLKKEMEKATKKERYLSKDDAKLLNNFIKKIKKELNESDN